MPAFIIEKLGSDLILRNKYGSYSKNELEFQLRTGHLTVRELGQAYYLKEYQIVHILRSMGILYRNSLNDCRVINSNITPEAHQVLLGTLLGDAFMIEPKSYQVAHSSYQTKYLYHIADFLNPFIATVGDRKVKTGEVVFFWTFRHDIFIPYFNRFYSHGKTKKYLTIESIQGLDARGLAFWYMDDGKYNEYGAYLCVGNISHQEGSVLINYLRDTFNIESTFQSQDNKKGYYNIYVKAESRDHFFNLIGPYVISSMRYKIVGEAPNKSFSESFLINGHLNLCKKAHRFIRYKGRSTVNDYIKANCFEISEKQNIIKSIQENMKENKQVSFTKIRELPSETEFKEMFLKEGLSDNMVAQKTGFGRNRIALLRKSLGIEDKKKRRQF